MSNGYKTKYVMGQHNVECMRCRGWFKSAEMSHDGQYPTLLVCPICWDPDPKLTTFAKIPVIGDPYPVPEVQAEEPLIFLQDSNLPYNPPFDPTSGIL